MKGSASREEVLGLYFPQWQGAGERGFIPEGARALRDTLASSRSFVEVPVETDGASSIERGIRGRTAVLKQLRAAKQVIASSNRSLGF